MSSQLDVSAVPRPTDLLPGDVTGLTVLHGLPGSGRSSLVREWLSRSPARTASWLDVASSTPETAITTARDSVVVVRGLTRESESRWLPSIQAWLAGGADVVVIGEGPFTLSGWPLSRTVIGPQDLAWDESQVRDSFARRSVEATDEVITAITAETGGWAALATAAVEAWPIGSIASNPGPGLTAAATALRGGLLSRALLAEHSDVLRALCLETHPEVGMIEALVGSGAASMIDDLRSLGLVSSVLDGPASAVGLLPMVRRHLSDEPLVGGPQKPVEQHRRAGDWYAQAGRPAQAMEHRVLGEDWPALLETLDRWSLDLVLEVPFDELRTALLGVMKTTKTDLPPGIGHLAEFLGALPLGTTAVLPPGSGTDERALKMMLVAMISRRRAYRMNEALEISDRMSGLVEGPAAQMSDMKGVLPAWFLNHGLNQVLAVDIPGGRDTLNRAWRLRHDDPFGFVGRAAAALLAALETVFGDPALGQIWLTRCHSEPLPPPQLADWSDAPLSIAEQTRAGDLMDFELAGSYQDVGFEWFDELWPVRMWVQFRHHIQEKDNAVALAMVDRAERRFPGAASSDGLHAAAISGVRGLGLLMTGQATRASSYAEQHQELILGVIAWARLKLFGGDAEGCYRLAVSGLVTFGWSPRCVLSLQTTAAAAALAAGRVEEGGERLEDAIAIARSRQMVGLMIDVPRELFEIYAHLPSVAEMLETLDDVGWKPAFPADALVVKLTERERVVLGELVSGRSVEQMSRSLVVSVNTVKSQVRSLYRKLGVHDRVEALAEADRLGLLPPTAPSSRGARNSPQATND